MQTFSNSIYLIVMKKQVNSGSLLISAVFGTRENVDSRGVLKQDLLEV